MELIVDWAHPDRTIDNLVAVHAFSSTLANLARDAGFSAGLRALHIPLVQGTGAVAQDECGD